MGGQRDNVPRIRRMHTCFMPAQPCWRIPRRKALLGNDTVSLRVEECGARIADVTVVVECVEKLGDQTVTKLRQLHCGRARTVAWRTEMLGRGSCP